MKTTLSLWLILLLSVIPAYGREICRSPDDYLIAGEYIVLDPATLLSSEAEQFFREHVSDSPADELFLVVSTEPEPAPYVRAVSAHDPGPTELVYVPLSVAYVYKTGANVYFEYRLNNSNPKWVVRSGENVFSKSFGEATAHLVGDYFGACMNRTLYLVVPELQQIPDTTLERIVLFYDSIFPYPEKLFIRVYERFQEVPRRVYRPTLHAVAGGYGPEEEPVSRASFYRGSRYPTMEVVRDLTRYRGNSVISDQLIE